MNVEEIIEQVEALLDMNGYVGIRTQDTIPFEMGIMLHDSKNFDSRDLFGDEEGIENAEDLDGCCAWSLSDGCCNLRKNAKKIIEDCIENYGHCAIMVSDSAEYGMDVGEIVMKDASVVIIIK